MLEIIKPVVYLWGAWPKSKSTEPIAARAKTREKNWFNGFDYYNFHSSTKLAIEQILTDAVKLEALKLRVSEKDLKANDVRSISNTDKKDYGAVVISEKLGEMFYRSELFDIAAEMIATGIFDDEVLFYVVMRDLEEFKKFITKWEVRLNSNEPSIFYPKDRTQTDMKEWSKKIKTLMEEYDIQVITPSIDRTIVIEDGRIIDSQNIK